MAYVCSCAMISGPFLRVDLNPVDAYGTMSFVHRPSNPVIVSGSLFQTSIPTPMDHWQNLPFDLATMQVYLNSEEPDHEKSVQVVVKSHTATNRR